MFATKFAGLIEQRASRPVRLDDEFLDVSAADCSLTCGSSCTKTCEITQQEER